MRFIFRAKDQSGNLKQGKIDAISREMALQILQREGLVPFFLIEESRGWQTILELKRIWEGVSQKDLMIFFRQLTTLISASVPPIQSLLAVASQTENKFIKSVAKELADDVQEGMSLSESMARHPRAFSPLAVNIIKSGEVSGTLSASLDYVTKNIQKNYQFNSKIRGALIYPSFVIGVAVIIGFIVVSFILPKISAMISELGIDPPWYTLAIMTVGDFMAKFWWAVLIVIFGAIFGFVYYIKSEVGKREWDIIKLELPLFGKLFRYIYISRFVGNLSILISSGIPIVKALVIVSDVVGNSVYKSILLRAADEVKTGGNVSDILSQSVYVPPIVSRMVKIGEETGKIDEALNSINDFYSEEIDNMTRNFSSLLEPVLIVILGIGVAIMVFAVLMPIYSIVDKM